jgi:hypothetical protein
MTPGQAAAALGSSARELSKRVLAPIRKGMRLVVRDSKRGYKNTSLGQALWGRGVGKYGKPSLIVNNLRARRSTSQEAFVAGVQIVGMAAIMEEGGRTKAHPIRPRQAGALYFKGRSGRLIRAGAVEHPGSRIDRRNVAGPLFDRAVAQIERELADTMERTIVERL